jgi:MFS transporter, UMF1 family
MSKKTQDLHNFAEGQILIDNKKTIRAWSFYDWANSAYNLIITSAIFPSYFTAIVPDKVSILNWEVPKASIASWSISLAFLIIAFLSPLLSAIADYKGNKKSFMRFFCTLGAIACLLLFFFQKTDQGTNTWYGVLFSIIACIGYCGSIVFYNAYLPEIASKENQDKVSAKGFIMGYIGSVVLLVVCLALIMGFEKFNKDNGQILVRISFLLVGVWWLGWSQIPFRILKDNPAKDVPKNINVFSAGYKKIGEVFLTILPNKLLLWYLLSFFFATMGVQTTMYMATYFAAEVINLATSQLIITVLLIQLVAIGGAYLTSYLSKKIGNFLVLLMLLFVWIGICASAAFLVYTPTDFYILASVVGLVMGGTQSIARSTYSKLLPDNSKDNASYFSFFDVVEKMGIVIGTLTFGFVAAVTGMRMSALALGVYFILSALIMIYLLKYNRNFIKK